MGYVSSVSNTVTTYKPITTSGDISFSGLGNGTDFKEIIKSTVDAESVQVKRYKEKKKENEQIVSLLKQLQTSIKDFNKVLDHMDAPDELYSMKGSVSDDQVSVTVEGDADIGTHSIIVNQLARKDIWINTATAYASEDTVIAPQATTLSVDFQGKTIDIDVAAGTTLKGLVERINSDVNARDKFEASIMDDGNGSYFVLKSKESGSKNTIAITSTGTLDGMYVSTFANTQPGQSAQIKVDGFPVGANQWIERSTNSIDDVVKGVTFDLLDTTGGSAVQVKVGYNTDKMFDTISNFVEKQNQVILDLQVMTGRVTQKAEDGTDKNPVTIESYGLDIVYNQMKYILSSSALGFKRYDKTTGGDYYTALSQIGFKTDADEGSDTYGQIILDDDKLKDALKKDPTAVASLFSARAEGESDSDGFQVVSVIDGVTPPGENKIQYTVSGGALVSATINGQAADVDGWTILGTGEKSKGLYLLVSNQGDGDFEGIARVKQGKIGQQSDSLDKVTVKEKGTIPLLIENYEKMISNLDDQIYNEEKRLDALETSLKRRYATLDTTLASYDKQSKMLAAITTASSKKSS